jgi:hypothetical protein
MTHPSDTPSTDTTDSMPSGGAAESTVPSAIDPRVQVKAAKESLKLAKKAVKVAKKAVSEAKKEVKVLKKAVQKTKGKPGKVKKNQAGGGEG